MTLKSVAWILRNASSLCQTKSACANTLFNNKQLITLWKQKYAKIVVANCRLQVSNYHVMESAWQYVPNVRSKKRKENKIKKEISMKAEVEAQRSREHERAQMLQTFLPCELMRELKRRGYEGTLTLKQEIDICNV